MMSSLTLRTIDGKEWVVDSTIAQYSKTIKRKLEDSGDEEKQQHICLENVNDEIFKIVMLWCAFVKNIVPKNEKLNHRRDDYFFHKFKSYLIDRNTLYNVHKAAIYLDISGLVEFTERELMT